MTVRIGVTTSGRFSDWVGERRLIAEKSVQAGITAATDGLKLDLRQMVAGAGLGERLGNAIGSAVYPKGQPSLGAASSIYARGDSADRVLTVFSTGATIRGKKGLMAIPTANAPRSRGVRGGSRKATPVEVEAQFGRDLRFVPLRKGKVVGLLVMDEVVPGRSGRGFKPATKRRRAAGRQVQSIVMFVLIREVRLSKRLDPEQLAAKWIDAVPGLIDRALPAEI